MHTDGGVFDESERDRQPGSVKDVRFPYAGDDTPSESSPCSIRAYSILAYMFHSRIFCPSTWFCRRHNGLIPYPGVFVFA